jgi:hypothetical protein
MGVEGSTITILTGVSPGVSNTTLAHRESEKSTSLTTPVKSGWGASVGDEHDIPTSTRVKIAARLFLISTVPERRLQIAYLNRAIESVGKSPNFGDWLPPITL